MVVLHAYEGKRVVEKTLVAALKEEGAGFEKWSNDANDEYAPHSHPYTTILVCIKGSITFRTHPDGRTYEMNQGDRMILPRNTIHSAVVGKKGCVCAEVHQK